MSMGEENNIFSGDCVLMMCNDIANLKPIGKVAENSVSVESEDNERVSKPTNNSYSFGFRADAESGKALVNHAAMVVLKEANRMLDRLNELSRQYNNEKVCNCRRERRAIKRKYDKIYAVLMRYCEQYGLKIKRKEE